MERERRKLSHTRKQAYKKASVPCDPHVQISAWHQKLDLGNNHRHKGTTRQEYRFAQTEVFYTMSRLWGLDGKISQYLQLPAIQGTVGDLYFFSTSEGHATPSGLVLHGTGLLRNGKTQKMYPSVHEFLHASSPFPWSCRGEIEDIQKDESQQHYTDRTQSDSDFSGFLSQMYIQESEQKWFWKGTHSAECVAQMLFASFHLTYFWSLLRRIRSESLNMERAMSPQAAEKSVRIAVHNW